MKKKIGLFLVICFIASIQNVEATSGRISASKITYCSGVPYGRHGKDEHWHKAEKNGDYWNAIGPDLGYSHPCPSTPAANTGKTTSNAAVSKPVTKKLTQAELDRIAKEEAQRIEQERVKKLEAERIAKEEAERLKLEEEKRIQEEKFKQQQIEIENKRLNSTKLLSVLVNGSRTSSINEIFYSNIQEDLSIKSDSSNAKISAKEVSYIAPFSKGKIEIEITSENGLNKEVHSKDVIKIGTQMDLENQEIYLVYNDTRYPYIDKKFSIPSDELRGYSDISPVLEINDIKVDTFTSKKVNLQTEKDESSISFNMGAQSYILEVEVVRDDNRIGLAVGTAAISSLGGLGYYSVKRKKAYK